MKKLFILLALSALGTNFLLAQDDDLPPPTSKPKDGQTSTSPSNTGPDSKNFQGFSKPKKIDLSKYILEPDFYFSIAGQEIDFGISPLVGYNVWKGLYVGGSLTYMYTGYRNIGFLDPVSGNTYYTNANYHTFGGGPMIQYNIWKGFFARAHLEVFHRIMDDIYGNVTVQVNPSNNGYRIEVPKIQTTVPDLLIGAGYNLLRSKNIFFPIMISYNVLSPVTNPEYAVYPHGVVIQLGFIDIF